MIVIYVSCRKARSGDLIETLIFFKGFDKLAKKHNVKKVKTIEIAICAFLESQSQKRNML